MEGQPQRVVHLLGAEPAPLDELGGKGASLARMIQRGLPVPPTAVIDAQAYRAATRDPGLAALLAGIARSEHPPDPDIVDAAFLDADLPRWVESAIVETLPSLGPRIAVRSSAWAEDLADQSFAGQYRSELGVASDGPDALRAVRLVWASLWHPAPWSYRRAWGVRDEDATMAVVAMSMVDARSAGVVFTIDPTGEDALRIESVEGLGESLVSGERTPTVWLLDRSPEADLPVGAPDELRTLRRLSLDLETREGRALDIEWAWDGDVMWLVQSRPITVTGGDGDGFDSEACPHELTTAGIEEMLPGVLPPLRWECVSFVFEEAYRRTLAPLGGLAPEACSTRPFLRRVRGRAALDLDLMKESVTAVPGGSAAALERQYFSTPAGDADPPERTGGRAFRPGSRLRRDVRSAAVRRRNAIEADITSAATEALLSAPPDLAARTAPELLAYRLRLLDLAVRTATAELALAAAAGASYDRLEALLVRELGDAGPGWTQRVTRGAGLPPAPRPTASRSVFAGPTWAETDRTPLDAAHREATSQRADLRRALQRSPGWRRRRILTGQVVDVRAHLLERLADDTIRDLEMREASKSAVLAIGGEVRRIHLELGTRLTASGAIPEPGTVEFLTTEELAAALDGAPVPPAVLSRRRRWHRTWSSEGPLPARFVGAPERAPSTPPEGASQLRGRPAGPGRYTGTAVALSDPDDAFPEDAILVAVTTDASWSPTFLRAGAIVVERGGPLSHAAIVARELGLPAVLDVAGATHLLDGRTVTVDGDSGTCTVHLEGASAGSPRREVGA